MAAYGDHPYPMISSADMISMYMAIEFQSLCFYVLAAFKRNSAFSTEAGLKYFVLGAFSSGVLLFGCSLIYGFTGITHFSELTKIFSCTSGNQHFTGGAPCIIAHLSFDSPRDGGPESKVFVGSSALRISASRNLK